MVFTPAMIAANLLELAPSQNMNRDDFNLKTKDTLAKRVGMRCSNPDCRQPTSGPETDPQGASYFAPSTREAAAKERHCNLPHKISAI
jgi:hypothetical protein